MVLGVTLRLGLFVDCPLQCLCPTVTSPVRRAATVVVDVCSTRCFPSSPSVLLRHRSARRRRSVSAWFVRWRAAFSRCCS